MEKFELRCIICGKVDLKKHNYHCGWCGKAMQSYKNEFTIITEDDIHVCCSRNCRNEFIIDEQSEGKEVEVF